MLRNMSMVALLLMLGGCTALLSGGKREPKSATATLEYRQPDTHVSLPGAADSLFAFRQAGWPVATGF